MFNVGYHYFMGKVCHQSDVGCARSSMKSVRFNLQGVEQSFEQAAAWYEKAAAQGFTWAQVRVVWRTVVYLVKVALG